MASQKRIAKELAECTASPPPGMTVTLPDESDVHRWHVVVEGPEGTVYQGGRFGVVVALPAEYPFKAPHVTFATRIYHPNVTNDSLGQVCLGALKPENWKPSTRLRAVLEAVRALLVEPAPDDPLEARIADEFRRDRAEFDKNARAYVQRYAKGPVKFDDGPDAAPPPPPGTTTRVLRVVVAGHRKDETLVPPPRPGYTPCPALPCPALTAPWLLYHGGRRRDSSLSIPK